MKLQKIGPVRGVGIDIVSTQRVKKLLRHGKKKVASRILSKNEQTDFRKKNYSAQFFARLFAAKEAYFKALGRPWLGVDGFKLIEVSCLPGSRFKVKSLSFDEPSAQGCFFETSGMSGAQVIV